MENEKSSAFSYEMINLNKIIANKENFYSVDAEGVKKLSESILEVGLLHDIVVSKIPNDSKDRYKIISGERRYRAIKLLYNEKKHENVIMCKVLKNTSDIDLQIALIKGNSDTRILSNKEKRKQLKMLENLYKAKEESSGKKIPVQKLVAEDIGMSVRNTRRISLINSKLIDELQELYDNSKISLVNAEKFARYDVQDQYIILEALKAGVNLREDEIEYIKNENKNLVIEIGNKNEKLDSFKKVLEEKNQEANILKVKLDDAALKLENMKNNIDIIRAEIKKEQEEENKDEVIRLKSDLKYLISKHEELKRSKKALEISLFEKDIEVKKEKVELEETINNLKEELSKKSEKIKFDQFQKEKEIRKKLNVDLAYKYKDEIISLIQKIADLDYIESNNIDYIKDEVKTFLKILK